MNVDQLLERPEIKGCCNRGAKDPASWANEYLKFGPRFDLLDSRAALIGKEVPRKHWRDSARPRLPFALPPALPCAAEHAGIFRLITLPTTVESGHMQAYFLMWLAPASRSK